MAAPTITFAVAAGKIDAEAGVIRGVSLISEGPALGHGVMVDARTLEQVKAAAEQYEGGLKVKLDHNSGAGDIIGYVDALRIEGKKLLGDLHLLQNSPHRAYVLEIAEKIPDTFGLSIAFSGPVEMSSDKKTMLQRCTEIYSVDLVSEPAANKTGLFERRMKAFQTESGTMPEEEKPEIEITIPMNDDVKKEIAGMIESAMMGMTERLGKLEALACGTEPKPAAMSAKNDEVQLAAKQAAEAALKEFAKTIGAPAAPAASAEVAAPAKSEAKSFEAIVAAKTSELKGNKGDAIAFAIKNHAAEYQQYRSRVAAGEVVKL
jgi:hypothetical protein